MSRDYEAEIAKHRQSSDEISKRIDRLLAEHDPLYATKYYDKRSILMAQILAAKDEVERARTIYESKQQKHSELVKSLEALDQARKEWKPM